MNEGRLFLYVSPTVVIPLMFLVLVGTALTVHFAILNNTTWFGEYWQGSATAAVEAPAMEAAAAEPMMMEAAAPAAEEAPAMEAEAEAAAE
jgi:light-harvesting protein B-800-850 alpha chain